MRYAIILILIKDSITDDEHRLDAFERPSGVGFAIDLKQDLIHVLNVKIATFIQDALIVQGDMLSLEKRIWPQLILPSRKNGTQQGMAI